MKHVSSLLRVPLTGNHVQKHIRLSHQKATMQDDTRLSLEEICKASGSDVLPRLLAIQQYRIDKVKYWPWAEKLKLLAPSILRSTRSREKLSTSATTARKTLRASIRKTDEYVAVSYPCEPGPDEPERSLSYVIRSSGTKHAIPSRVRDAVLDRVVKYMQHHRVPYLWIDQDCINQDDPDEHQEALQSMDMVYQKSRHALALLFAQVEAQEEMDLLALLLQNKLVYGFSQNYSQESTKPGLDPELSMRDAPKLINLLKRLTSDPWWSRGWCFQEEYLAKNNMHLLIPHSPGLEKDIPGKPLGSMFEDNEIEVDAGLFRRRLTQFCMACILDGEHNPSLDTTSCRQILEKASRYTTLSQYGEWIDSGRKGKAMSSSIIHDIGTRQISRCRDIIPLIANCCAYSTSLDINKLEDARESLSLSVLALYLLNGEVISNKRDPNKNSQGGSQPSSTLLTRSIYNVLKQLCFNRFDPPVAGRELSFMKKYRFTKPILSLDGIQTSGHIWKIDHVLDVSGNGYHKRIRRSKSRDSVSSTDSDDLEDTLWAIQRVLKGKTRNLAKLLKQFLKEDFHVQSDSANSSEMMSLEAGWIASMVREQQCVLGLGHIVTTQNPIEDTDDNLDNKMGLFILDLDHRKQTEDVEKNPIYAFVSWQAGAEADDKYYKGQPDEDKFISLRVTIDKKDSNGTNLPSLRTEDWIHGLCFFAGVKKRKVVFPWPDSLLPT